ncbi:hypothetical protein D9M68_790100 [compost metagenome]
MGLVDRDRRARGGIGRVLGLEHFAADVIGGVEDDGWLGKGRGAAKGDSGKGGGEEFVHLALFSND